MPLAPLSGHHELRARLNAAIHRDRLPQVLLVTGPNGVGKQRLALWLAQRLVCEIGGDEPCDRCGPCLKVLNLTHPDVHWMVPVPRPKAGDTDKQIDEVAEALETAMAERRVAGVWGPPEGLASHGVATARLLQRRASRTASEGGWRVFIIGRAERLVPQESSPEAANALLKLLEEPPAHSMFILTTAEPGMVLPTIRSRAVPVRVGRQSTAVPAAPSADAERAAKSAAVAGAVLDAVAAGRTARTSMALKQGVSQARGEFTSLLDALASELGRRANRFAASADGSRHAMQAADGIDRVLLAREQAQGNANPQLVLAALMDDLAALQGAA
jgi:DNA polymerase-3 subunit delta'